MVQLMIAAFAMGVIGSFHCVGMCGPIALSIPVNTQNNWAKFSGAFIYNLGRVFTYSLFGLLFGFIGKTVALFGFQQKLSIIVGALILVVVLVPKKYQIFKNKNFAVDFFSKIRASIAALFRRQNYNSLFFIGLLNGLLPCGLVYMAAAAAVATGSVFNSVVFMAAFGAGTLPMMWSLAFLGNFIKVNIRQKIRKLYPYLMVVIACLLILRGMGLGIKYVSPALDSTNKISHSCGVAIK